MDKFTYDMFYEIEKPTVILSSVYHKHYGVLENVDMDSFTCTFNMNGAQEISFDVYKYFDEHLCSLWDKLISFKYVYIPQHNEYYKIDVTLDQDNKTVKHITGTSAGEYELSQRKLISLEVNTEGDLTYYEQKNEQGEWEKIDTPANKEATILYNPDNTHKSLLHRAIVDRAPDWIIGHVDSTVAKKQRTFSVSNQTIYDFLTNTVATELDLLFKFDSVNRIISVYDLLNICTNCGERGEFTDVCPKCGGTNIRRGYGNDSHIYISANNYANKITVDGDEGNVKNCFRVLGGDDLMTATIKNCNPSGSEYIYQFSEADYDDMPEDLVQKLEEYAELYKTYEDGKTKENTEFITTGQYTTVNCGFKPDVLTIISLSGSGTWKYEYGVSTGDNIGNIQITDTGFIIETRPGSRFVYTATQKPYAELTKDYYNALTEYYYYKTSMMPRSSDHWQPNTGYNEGDTCYVITLPSYCHLECVEEGTSGSVEFDATDVIPPDKPEEHVYITDGTVKWEVVRNILNKPKASQALADIKAFVPTTVVYFEDTVPAGITADPKTYTTINRYVKDLLATVIDPLFKIDITNGAGTEPKSEWHTDSYFPDTDPPNSKIKTGRLDFNLKITNTSDTSDVATTQEGGDWHPLTIRCAVADSLTEHQEYMAELIKKRLDQKDNTFTTLYDLTKTKSSSINMSSTSATVDCGFRPEYVVVQYISGNNDYTIIYKDGTSTGVGGTITVNNTGFVFSNGVSGTVCYYTAVTDNDFRMALEQYSYDMLEGFAKSYEDCRNTLIANHITDSEGKDFHGVNIYDAIYVPYNNKIEMINNELVEREQTVIYYYNNPEQKDDDGVIPVGNLIIYDTSKPPGLIQRIGYRMSDIHKILDLKEFLKDDEAEDPDWMWHVLFNYIREGEYQNSNYISDGLSNNVLVKYATEVLDKGALELKKATELQYSLSDELHNLLNTEEFAPFKDKFELGDYLICGIGDYEDESLDIDNHNYKLRLITLSYTYGSPESVNVTFANVTKIKNYFSDTQDILAQAKSMGSSYSTVTHQVEKNTNTTDIVSTWNTEGLQSSLTKIMNNNREEVSYDNSGIIVKEYDYDYDETKDNNTYSDSQLRITHDILAFTNDNWKTATLGLGKQDYVCYRNNVKTKETGYGLIAQFVNAGYINGSQIISSQLYSDAVWNDSGTTKPVSKMDFDNGTFDLARGNLTYDGSNLNIKANITILGGDLTVKDSSNNILFKADTTNKVVKIGGFDVKENAIYYNTSTMQSSTNGVYLGTNGIRNVGSTYIATISSGEVKIENKSDSTKYVSLVADAWTPPIGGSPYSSGRVIISDGTDTSYLTSKELQINSVEGYRHYCLGTYYNAPIGTYNCGGLISSPDSSHQGYYNGLLFLNGSGADIIINDTSIFAILQNTLGNQCTFVTAFWDYSINGNSTGTATKSFTVPSGYTARAVMLQRTGNEYVFCSSCNLAGNSVIFTLRNTGSAKAEERCEAIVICTK